MASPTSAQNALPEVQALIEAEADDYHDEDSAIGSDVASSTTSIGTSILSYRKENGRTYHAYKEGKYLIPNDEEENDRLDLQHHLFCLTFQNKLIVAPIPKDKVLHRVLDIGTGTGIWAIDFADEHPESEVIGVDLSPIQPSFIPPNLTFQIDDVEEAWTFGHKFDLIHSRMMTGAIADWPKLTQTIFDNLAPGGWCQLTDIVNPVRADDDTLLPNSQMIKWANFVLEGGVKMGRTADSVLHYKKHMIAAGFVDVQEVIYKWPTNRWPKDPRMKEIGMWCLENVSGGLSSLSLAIFTRLLGWSVEDLEEFLKGVRAELKDTRIHAWWPIYVVYGRKPE